ncbi:MAG: polyphosphate kinase 1 [Marinilabiliaceae bacterium]|nr:polyphosphate kinase 1 [Marinilabiliaceae bacterium]
MSINNYIPKEISWMAFNERVLQEAARKNVPLIERIKFLGIYSNNLDEFFRVRVAILKRLTILTDSSIYEKYSPADTLIKINQLVIKQSERFLQVYEDIIKDLEKENIYILNENTLNKEQGQFVRNYFTKHIRPRLMPLIINNERNLPDLRDEAIYLAVQFTTKEKNNETYALIEVPTDHISRFILLPSKRNKKYLILLEDVIRYELKDVFYMFDIENINAYTIKLTRDAELDINDDISENYIKAVAKGLEKRRDAHPVRFVYDKEIPLPLLKILLKKLNFTRYDSVIEGGRYHNFKDFMNFPNIGKIKMSYKPMPQIQHPMLPHGSRFFNVLKTNDVLLHFPYHSFHHFIDFLREASIDPNVIEIKTTIYRLAKKSNVVNALVNAARNGKKVTAILELQARFDEKANIKWSNFLKEEGVNVTYGVPKLKVHSKLVLVTRIENDAQVYYSGIGTGNFNEDSAKVFCDNILLTRHNEITEEVKRVFDFFDSNNKPKPFEYLMVSPFNLRNSFTEMVQNEINNAKKGITSFIYLKLNNLVDYTIIQLLYEAKKNGVDVRLNIRGMLSITPQFDQNCEPIPAIGIIDRYLEHSRIYFFSNGGKENIYISSADLMTRNLDRRVEVACPILDSKLKQELKQMWSLQWADNISARILDNSMSNKIKAAKGHEKTKRSQLEFYKYMSKRK